MEHVNKPGMNECFWKLQRRHCCCEGRINLEEGDGKQGNVEKFN